jgi:hypothetical protein
LTFLGSKNIQRILDLVENYKTINVT